MRQYVLAGSPRGLGLAFMTPRKAQGAVGNSIPGSQKGRISVHSKRSKTSNFFVFLVAQPYDPHPTKKKSST